MMVKKEGSEEDKRFITQILCKIWSFESIFGSNTIDVNPSSVEMDLEQDLPSKITSFSPRNRSNLSFDFDQRISMSGNRCKTECKCYDTQSSFQ
jgi:cell surface protein SprA